MKKMPRCHDVAVAHLGVGHGLLSSARTRKTEKKVDVAALPK